MSVYDSYKKFMSHTLSGLIKTKFNLLSETNYSTEISSDDELKEDPGNSSYRALDENVPAPRLEIPLELNDGALTDAQALIVFDQLADMADIPFGYAHDGCYARAHVMCQRMKETGLNPGKSWAFEDRDPLTVEKENGEKVQWWFHVAAAHLVVGADGVARDMVFDPSLFDGPVTLQEWGEVMQANPNKLQIKPLDVPPNGYKGTYAPMAILPNNDEHAKETFMKYTSLQDPGQRVVFNSQIRQQFLQQDETPVAWQGKTWKPLRVSQNAVVASQAMQQTPKPNASASGRSQAIMQLANL